MSILRTVRDADYHINDDQVEDLVKMRHGSSQVTDQSDTDYFRVLVQRTKDGTVNARTTSALVVEFEKINGRLFEIVKRAVITPDICSASRDSSEEKARKTSERQRRTMFARSAASELRTFLKFRGKSGLDSLTASEIQKSTVQKMNKQSRSALKKPTKSDDDLRVNPAVFRRRARELRADVEMWASCKSASDAVLATLRKILT